MHDKTPAGSQPNKAGEVLSERQQQERMRLYQDGSSYYESGWKDRDSYRDLIGSSFQQYRRIQIIGCVLGSPIVRFDVV